MPYGKDALDAQLDSEAGYDAIARAIQKLQHELDNNSNLNPQQRAEVEGEKKRLQNALEGISIAKHNIVRGHNNMPLQP
ncbi:hypothetical protein [Hymenobacter sp. BT491]|uniref:hypothetical protein n=1 Tax=Hymenobacter sp. BT491 TaxID=2766779 RepID=UPI0016538692|nr:hypothetical protein [Hymenobacter sp. BT491]MBC6991673.1 hypothetical protein [Hymenobacter sp. BT491]